MYCVPCAEKKNIVLTIVGCGGIGQPLALLLKHHDSIGELRVFDLLDTTGIAMDLSHINTRAKVIGYTGCKDLKEACENTNIVVISAAAKRQPNMTTEDFFDTSAEIVKTVAGAVADGSPNACVCIVTEPVNSMVPLASEVFRQKGKLDPRKIFGINAIDQLRASTFTAEVTGMKPERVKVPVVGGHSGDTLVPLLSQVEPAIRLTYREIKTITDRVIQGDPDVVQAKKDKAAATLSVAHAVFKFLESLIGGLTSKPDIVEYAFVRSDITEAKYFCSACVLGRSGAEEILELGTLSKFEKEQLAEAVSKLQDEIQRGEDYARSSNDVDSCHCGQPYCQ